MVGLLADRWFAAEKVIAVMRRDDGSCSCCAAWWWCDHHDSSNADPADAVSPLFTLILGYAVGMQITLTLTNVIGFRNLTNVDVFWYVRLTGTFGWIVAGVVVGWIPETDFAAADVFGGCDVRATLGLRAWRLPRTPPKGYGRPVSEVLGLPAIKMFGDRSFVAFAAVLVLCNVMNQFYTLQVPSYLKHLGVQVDLGE